MCQSDPYIKLHDHFYGMKNAHKHGGTSRAFFALLTSGIIAPATSEDPPDRLWCHPHAPTVDVSCLHKGAPHEDAPFASTYRRSGRGI